MECSDCHSMTLAASRVHLGCLQELHAKGKDWNRFLPAFVCAGEEEDGRRLSCLRWLRTSGCPWDRNTPAMAAASGNVACLRYAHENNCSWDSGTPEAAADRYEDEQDGRLECLRYARDNGCAWHNDVCAVLFDGCAVCHCTRCPGNARADTSPALAGLEDLPELPLAIISLLCDLICET